MDFTRNNQRRRRVTIDQQSVEKEASPVPQPSTKPQPPGRSQQYMAAARRRQQLRTTDLIPKRMLTIVVLTGALVAGVVLLNLVHANVPLWEASIGSDGAAALSLGSGGIAMWYANFLLMLTSCACLQVYLLRQHRNDDYRGSYRLWVWLAGTCILASLACLSNVQALLTNLGAFLIGSATQTNSTSIGSFIKLACLVLITARVMYEVRLSRSAMVSLVLVFIGYAVAVIAEIPQVLGWLVTYLPATQVNCFLIGTSGLLVTVLLYARFVYFQAHGLIAGARPESLKSNSHKLIKKSERAKRQPQEPKKKPAASSTEPLVEPRAAAIKTKQAKTSKGTTKNSRSPSEAGVAKKSNSSPNRAKTKTPVSTKDSHLLSLDDEDSGLLSKSERRRQRKLKRREKRAA